MQTTNQYARSTLRVVIQLAILLSMAPQAFAQSYTLSPSPFLLAQNNSGAIINNACIWTYASGTTTPISTYSDNAGTPNANPIRSDSAGRFTAYLLAGVQYKFVYENVCTPPSHGTVLRTADPIGGVPVSAANVEVTGTAGENISAGQVVYLSDGSSGKTAGNWYRADASSVFSSLIPQIGIAPSAIASAATGNIRISGIATGLSSLSVGQRHYVSTTPGALTSTSPANSRLVGAADSATSLVLAPNPPIPLVPDINDFRLTLTTATPVTTSDVTAATTLFWTPYAGNRVTLSSDGSGTLEVCRSTELSIAVPASTSQMYDVWVYDTSFGSCTLSLELLAWTNDTTRATAIARTTTGFLTKSGDLTRRYVGSFRTTTVSGQTEDSLTKRYVWNNSNRVPRRLLRHEANGTTWNYTTATIRQANASTSNQVDVIVGDVGVRLQLFLRVTANNSAGAAGVHIGIGEDSTTTLNNNGYVLGGQVTLGNGTTLYEVGSQLDTTPAIGRHFYSWNEWAAAVGTTTWNGNNGVNTVPTGLQGWIEG